MNRWDGSAGLWVGDVYRFRQARRWDFIRCELFTFGLLKRDRFRDIRISISEVTLQGQVMEESDTKLVLTK